VYPLTLVKAQHELKELLKSRNITLQGSAEKKLRDFSNKFGLYIPGLMGGAGGSEGKRKREEDYTSLLDRAVQEFESSTGKKVQRSALYALFE
jgi:hypothetical protein